MVFRNKNIQLTFYSAFQYHKQYLSNLIRICSSLGRQWCLSHILLNMLDLQFCNKASNLKRKTIFRNVTRLYLIFLEKLTYWSIKRRYTTTQFHRLFQTTFFHATRKRVFFIVNLQFDFVWKYTFPLSDTQLLCIFGCISLLHRY